MIDIVLQIESLLLALNLYINLSLPKNFMVAKCLKKPRTLDQTIPKFHALNNEDSTLLNDISYRLHLKIYLFLKIYFVQLLRNVMPPRQHQILWFSGNL